MPTTTSKGYMSPYQHVTGKIPNLTHLRKWGSKAFVNVPLAKRGKDFLPRAHIGYLIGYSEIQRDAYRIWLPIWNIIVISRNVAFDENIPQGDVNLETDEYWMELRQGRTSQNVSNRNKIDDYVYLEGVVFYDPDENKHMRVSKVATYTFKGVKTVVCWCTLYDLMLPEQQQSDIEIRPPTHVRDVEKMVAGYHDDDANELAEVAVETSKNLSTKHENDELKVALGAHHIVMGKGRYNSVLDNGDGRVEVDLASHYPVVSESSFDVKTQTSPSAKRKLDDRQDNEIFDDLGYMFPRHHHMEDHHVLAGRCRTREAQSMIPTCDGTDITTR